MAPRSTLNVSLTAELLRLIGKDVSSGRCQSASEVIGTALRRFYAEAATPDPSATAGGAVTRSKEQVEALFAQASANELRGAVFQFTLPTPLGLMILSSSRPIFIVTRDILVRQRSLEMLKEHVVVDRLREIRVCPALERPASAHGIIEGGHDDHRHGRPHGPEPLEQFDSGETGHADVGDQAVEPAGCIGCQERFGSVEDLTRAPHDVEQLGEGLTDGLVVIHDGNNRWLGQADAFVAATRWAGCRSLR